MLLNADDFDTRLPLGISMRTRNNLQVTALAKQELNEYRVSGSLPLLLCTSRMYKILRSYYDSEDVGILYVRCPLDSINVSN